MNYRIYRHKALIMQLKVFFKMWTGKEVYLKATGQGLNIALKDVDVLSNEGNPGFFITDVEPTMDFFGAITVKGTTNKIKTIDLSKFFIYAKMYFVVSSNNLKYFKV